MQPFSDIYWWSVQIQTIQENRGEILNMFIKGSLSLSFSLFLSLSLSIYMSVCVSVHVCVCVCVCMCLYVCVWQHRCETAALFTALGKVTSTARVKQQLQSSVGRGTFLLQTQLMSHIQSHYCSERHVDTGI